MKTIQWFLYRENSFSTSPSLCFLEQKAKEEFPGLVPFMDGHDWHIHGMPEPIPLIVGEDEWGECVFSIRFYKPEHLPGRSPKPRHELDLCIDEKCEHMKS